MENPEQPAQDVSEQVHQLPVETDPADVVPQLYPGEECTVYSGKLNRVLENLKIRVGEDFIAKFEEYETDEGRISHLWQSEDIHDMLMVAPDFQGKSVADSQASRLAGNKLFQEKKFREALGKFNESVLAAPWMVDTNDENVLALGFANRSAALLFLKRYQQCIQDIDQAMIHDYPKENAYKLFERRGKCFMHLKDRHGAVESFHKAMDSLECSGLKQEELETWKENLTKKLEEAEKVPIKKDSSQKKAFSNIPEVDRFNRNSKYPCASGSFDIEHSEEVGRHGIARKLIRIGEIVGVEKPFASVLYPEKNKSHCQHCFKQPIVMYPCPQCSEVAYCSPECQKISWDNCHHLECRYMGHLHTSWMGRIGHLSLRMAIQKGCRNLLDFLKSVKENEGNDVTKCGFTDGVYRNDYASAYHLVSMTSSRPMDFNFEFTVMAVLLLKILKDSGCYFQEESTNEEDYIHIGGALLTHLQIVQCNAFGIPEYQSIHDFNKLAPLDIGSGLYGTASLMNHSCDPTIDFYYYGDEIVYRAIRLMREGDEISQEYGPVFHAMPTEERKLSMQFQYFFDCHCRACTENWPVWQGLQELPPTFRCRGCGRRLPMINMEDARPIRCMCGHEEDVHQNLMLLSQSHELTMQAVQNAIKGDIDNAISMLCIHMSLLEELISPPWKDFYSCQAALKQCYRMQINRPLPKTS